MSLVNKKLIATASPKNAEKARKRLDGTRITISLFAKPAQEMTCAEAITYANSLLAEGDPHSALSIADQLLEIQDQIIDIYLLKVRALLDLEALYELDSLIEELLDVAPDNIGVLVNASRFYLLLGRVKEAFSALKKINEISPNRIETFSQMALCYRYSGAGDKAIKLLERSIGQVWKRRFSDEERNAQYRSVLFRYAGYKHVEGEMRQDLENFAGSGDDRIAASAAYALAQQSLFEKNIQDEQRYLVMANLSENKYTTRGVELKHYLNEYERVRKLHASLFASSQPEWLESEFDSDFSPIYILGLPRSGTTLMEQILGASSKIGQTGESKGFSLAVEKAFLTHQPAFVGSPHPEDINRLPMSAFHEIARYYERHQSVMTKKYMYIDKELYNFNYVGLMAVLFPKAKFIHMNRAPMDIFLSCFKNSIPGVHATSDLVHMAEYYVHMKKLIGHWKTVFEDRIFIMNYRDLVERPEDSTQQVVDYLGIGLENDMLKFHERKNVVRTLSVDQVRQKIYTSSIEKWRKYEVMLAPARARLEELGVPIEGVSYINKDS